MKDHNQVIGDGRMAPALVSITAEQREVILEKIAAKKAYIEYITKGYSLKTEQARWLRDRAGLTG